MQNRNCLTLFFCILVVIIFSLVSTAGAEVTGKIWKPLPLRTENQKLAGMSGGEGMQMVFSMSYAPSNPEIVYFTSNTSGVWKSEDGGYSWESKRNAFRSNGGVSLVVDPSNENVVFVSGSSHADRSTSPVDGIYRTLDGGDSWQLVYPTEYYRNKEGQHFVFDTQSFNGERYMTIYAGTYTKGLLKSIDGGDEWTVLGMDGIWILDIEINVDNSNNTVVLYVATKDGLYKVIDNGTLPVTISPLGDDLPDYPRTIAFNPQDNPDNDIIYAAVGLNKVYKSINGGQTFTRKDTGLTVDDKIYIIIDISKANPDYLYVSIDQDADNTFWSHDGGENWNPPSSLDDGLSITQGAWGVSVTAPHPDDPDIALHNFAGKSRISQTTDGGDNWHYSGNGYMGGRRSRNKTSTYFGPVTGNPDDREIIFFLGDFGPAVTYNNGDTWELLPIPRINDGKTAAVGAVDLNDPTNPDDDIIIAAVGKSQWPFQKIVRSTDGGLNWITFDGTDGITDDTNGSYQFMSFHPQDTNYVYAGASDGSWISNNKGETWTKVQQIDGRDISIRAIYPGNGDIVYAFESCIGSDDPVTGCSSNWSILWRSDDKGKIWDQVAINPFGFGAIMDVDISPDDDSRLYVAYWLGLYIYDGNIVANPDEIIRWTCITEKPADIPVESFNGTDSFSVHNVVVDPNDSSIVYAGMWAPYLGHREGFIYRSIDKGVNWEEIGVNLNGYSAVWGLSVDPANSALYMSIDHGNYVLCTDEDNDGYAVEGGVCGEVDCNDNNAYINPAAEEICNGLDDNCDGNIDEGDVCFSDITATAASKDFGSIAVGSVASSQIFTISNNGTADLVIGGVYLTGTNPYQFSIQSENCSEQTIAPSGSCTIEAIYAPTKTGTMNAKIGIDSDDPDTAHLYINLTGTGVELTPNISATPAGKYFGSVAVGSVSSSQVFTISNNGTADLVISGVYLTGTNPYQFSIQSENCSEQTIAPSGSCTIGAIYAPTKTGTINAKIGIDSDDPNTAQLYINLTGTGVELTPNISATPAGKDFGSVAVGSVSSSQIFTISNNGTADLVISGVYLTGTNPYQFSIQSENCSGQTIAPSGSCTIEAIYAPTKTGTMNAEIGIDSDDPDTAHLYINLRGTGS